MRAASAGLLACALIPLSLAVAACEPATVKDTSRHIYCEVMPDAPARDNRDAPKKVVGKVRFRCVEPGAATLALGLHLQHRNAAGEWVDVAAQTFTADGAETVRTEEERFRVREVSAPCTAGVFRMYVEASSTARGTTRTYQRTSPRSFDPCQPSYFASR